MANASSVRADREVTYRSRDHTSTEAHHGITTPATTPMREQRTPLPSAQDLSNSERAHLREKLDQAGKFFSIAMAPATQGKKRKRVTPAMALQTDMFDDRLSVHYEVRPQSEWDKLRKYKKFTVGSESISLGECVLIKHDATDSDEQHIDVLKDWKAKVHEVRALDTEHVYLRVSWLNRPEDLPNGRQPHHGKYELIPSNEMDVIDAMAVNGSIKVVHWDERADNSSLPGAEQFFWRQTLDYMTRKFSDLHRICRDKKPVNPDELILQCSNAKCRNWLHVKCLAEQAVVQAHKNGVHSPSTVSKVKSVQIDPLSAAQAKSQQGEVTAELFIRDLPSNNELVQPAKVTEIRFEGVSSDQASTADVLCLFCKEAID